MLLPEDDHFARYCRPTALDSNGLPNVGAFELRGRDKYLSVNWLEHFGAGDVNTAIEHVRAAFRQKGFGIKRNGGFAVLHVGSATAAVEKATNRSSCVEHLPDVDDPSHAGLFGYTPTEAYAVALLLQALIQEKDVHPAVMDI